MKAAYIDRFGSSLKIGQLPDPKPNDDEVCIAVEYAGVNPVDFKIIDGYLESRLPHEFPLTLGWEASGTIHSKGINVTSFNIGDKVYVYCRKPFVKDGAFADFITYDAKNVSPAPANLSMAEAASIPLAGLTAWQGLFEKLKVQQGETVLIHGGGGGVGGFAIQFAKANGCHVIATSSAEKFAYVKSLGADEIIDYQAGNFVEQLHINHKKGVNAVFDTIGKDVYLQSFKALKAGGRIVSILEQPNQELEKKYDVNAEYLFVHPEGEELLEMARLFEADQIKPPKIEILPFEKINDAIAKIKSGHTFGKIVIAVNPHKS